MCLGLGVLGMAVDVLELNLSVDLPVVLLMHVHGRRICSGFVEMWIENYNKST
jgi:hypothetical protein